MKLRPLLVYLPIFLVYPVVAVNHFWSKFGVNPFEYLNLSETIGTSAMYVEVLLIILCLLLPIVTIRIFNFSRYLRILAFLITGINFTYFYFYIYYDEIWWFRLIGGLVISINGIFLAVPLYMDEMPFKKQGSIIHQAIIQGAVFLFLVASFVEFRADKILNSEKFRYTIIEMDTLKYIGHLGDKYFVLSMDNEELHIISDEIQLILRESE